MKNLILTLTIALILASCSMYGDSVTFNGTDVYYKDGVTIEDANKLGEYLVSSEFADGTEKSVMLVKDENGDYVFRMVVKEGAEEGNDFIFMMMGFGISMNAFDNAPVHVEACDNTFNTLRSFPYSDSDDDDPDDVLLSSEEDMTTEDELSEDDGLVTNDEDE